MASSILTADQQSVVDRVMNQPEHPEARRTVWELITLKAQQTGELFPLLRRHYAFAGVSDEQVLHVCRVSETSGDGLFMPNCLAGGIARRFAWDAPVELALRLSLAARYEWANSQTDRNAHPDELFRPLLHAAAAHDFVAVDRIASLPEQALQKPNNRDYALLLDALVGLVHGDDGRLRQAAAAMAKRRPSAYVKAMHQAAVAIAAVSPDQFADSLGKMLKTYPRYVYDDDVYRLVDPHAIGFYELARRCRPDVVGAFDTGRPLPWDAGYHEWLLTCDDVSLHFEVDRVPETVRAQVLDMEPLPWGPAFLANGRSNMANPPDPRSLLREGDQAN